MQLTFESEVLRWQAVKGAWWFVCLTSDATDQVRFAIQGRPRRGFGSLKVEVALGDSLWRTSIFPDKTRDTYLLPIKQAVRSQNSVGEGDRVSVSLRLLEV